MTTYNEQLNECALRIEQLKRRKKLDARRNQASKAKADTRRNIIIGEMICKYFPDVMEYQPCRNSSENAVAFASLDGFLKALSLNEEILTKLNTEALRLVSEDKTE